MDQWYQLGITQEWLYILHQHYQNSLEFTKHFLFYLNLKTLQQPSR